MERKVQRVRIDKLTRIAQLVERGPDKAEVGSSNLSVSTNNKEKIMASKIELVDHELLGLQMHNTSNGRIYHIKKVYKNWHMGWYLTALLEKNGTHRVCFIET